MIRRLGSLVLFGVLLLGPAAIAQKPGVPVVGDKALIEVHGPDIAFVPMSARYVTYDGKVRKVVKFTDMIEGGNGDCRCPKCCDGLCYVIIYTDLILPGGAAVRSPFILWIDCLDG